MVINHNMLAINTTNALSRTSGTQAKSMEKLSSGLRINRAGDDAAGLAISEKMRGQIRGLEQASRNAQDSISLVQTAEGALQETQSILQRMRELAVQSSNDTNVQADRDAIQAEVDQLATEITRIADTSEFNTQSLLDGTFKGTFQIGANKGQQMELTINKMDSETLGVAANEGVKYGETTGAADNGITGDATFDVVKLDASVDVNDGTDPSAYTVNYVLKNQETGQVEAVSNDGQNYYALGAATDEASLATATITGDVDNSGGGGAVTGFVFTDKVVSGTVTSDAAGTVVTGTNTVDFQAGQSLSSGEYTVVDTTHALVGAGFGLIDSNGELVAVSDNNNALVTNNGGEWTNVAGDKLMFDSAGTFAAGDTLKVTGEGGIDISSQTAANSAIETINDAITTVSSQRANLGAVQNRLEHTINNLDTSAENLQSAESRVRDVDMAKEMVQLTKNNILQQAAQSMLAQANQAPQGVLSLLR
ncbi:flagellin N-terminal helical domain-containing protein [Vallitalea okinawensis]|uniref:flagellin N-terminal helical domain-containing protein n=1 Tax=Vallitalea okinawensis TaxID=2078660 RepID=UPI000CFB9B09|nr:flagellin [Vallitalea okinawensis]